jgi:hypothetical protein
MILFHVPAVDSGDLRVWQRTILPACLLRRVGVEVRIVVGDLSKSNLSGASAVVLRGPIGANNTELLSRQARGTGLRVILDIADTRSLMIDPTAARSADRIIASNHELAALAAARLEPSRAIRVIADAPVGAVSVRNALAMYPAIGLRMLASVVKARATDMARRLRHRARAGRSTAQAKGFRIVWFGDGTHLNEEGGLGELLLAVGDLVELSQDIPFQLRVIGTSRRLFRRTTGKLPIQTEFRHLTIATLARDLRGADLCFLPGGGDPVSSASSAARAQIAIGLGIPVLTVPHGGLAGSPHLTLASDWPSALRSIVVGKATPSDVGAGPRPNAISDAWRSVVTAPELAEPAAERVQHPGNRPSRLRVIFLLQQFQDLDLILPVAEAATVEMEVTVAILTKIAVPATRRLRPLRERGAKLLFWRARELTAGKAGITLGDFDAAVTASDGAGPGARYATAFVRTANAAGIATLNLQHGLDNSGLTFGPPPAVDAVQFKSRFVLTWGGFERLTEAAAPATRAKVIPVGCPKCRLRPEDAADFPLAGRRFIAVFENLHWRRYGDDYRNRFVQDLVEIARETPDLIFVLKPHMGGRWFTRTNAQRPLPDNLIVADPSAPQWRRFAADSFLAHAAGAITTPSTIALDAARYGLPTALVGYGLPAENYAPLFRIEQTPDWGTFVRQVQVGDHDMTKVKRFHDAAVLPGNAVARTLDVIRLAAGGRSQAEILAIVTP